MQQRLPTSVLVGLGVLAGSTLVLGVVLEEVALGFLQAHPYIVNLLSGATGFSTGALVIALLLNRAVTAYRNDRWRTAAWLTVQDWQQHLTEIEALIDGRHWSGRRNGSAALYSTRLASLVRPRSGLRRITTPKQLPFTSHDGERQFIDHARTLAGDPVNELLEAFDAADDPAVTAHAKRFRTLVRRPGGPELGTHSFQVAHALVGLIDSVNSLPSYQALQRFSGSDLERMMAEFDPLAGSWLDKRQRRWRRRRILRWRRFRRLAPGPGTAPLGPATPGSGAASTTHAAFADTATGTLPPTMRDV